MAQDRLSGNRDSLTAVATPGGAVTPSVTIPATHGRFRGAHDTGPRSAPTAWRTGGNATDGLNYLGTPGTYSGINFVGPVTIGAAVILEDFTITMTEQGGTALTVTAAGAAGSEIRYGRIDGGQHAKLTPAVIIGPGGTDSALIHHCEVLGGQDTFRLGAGSVAEDMWIHSPSAGPGRHMDVCQATGGNFKLRRSRVEFGLSEREFVFHAGPVTPNAAFQFGSWGAPVTSGIVEDNFFDGGQLILSYNTAGSAQSGLEFRNNRFGQRTSGPSGVRTNPTFSGLASVTVWQNNVDDLTGAVIP